MDKTLDKITLTFPIFPFQQFTEDTTLLLREISVRTCSTPNTHVKTNLTHTWLLSFHQSLSLLCFRHYPGTGDYVTNKHTHTHTLFTLSPFCRLASLDASTCWNTSSSYNPYKQRPLLKLMKWKSPGNMWPLNMFLHIICMSSSEWMFQCFVSSAVLLAIMRCECDISHHNVLIYPRLPGQYSSYLMAMQFTNNTPLCKKGKSANNS